MYDYFGWRQEPPEVIGINGWCDNNAFIVLTEEDVNNLPYSSDCVCVFHKQL